MGKKGRDLDDFDDLVVSKGKGKGGKGKGKGGKGGAGGLSMGNLPTSLADPGDLPRFFSCESESLTVVLAKMTASDLAFPLKEKLGQDCIADLQALVAPTTCETAAPRVF